MKPLERPTHRVASRAGIIVFAAMMVLVLSSASARRAGSLMSAAATAAAAPAAGENNGGAQTSTGTDVKAALSAKEVRGATPYPKSRTSRLPSSS